MYINHKVLFYHIMFVLRLGTNNNGRQ